jgi:hypothetical protein
MDGRVNCDELLQTSHSPEALHGPFSSSERDLRFLDPVVQPPARLLFVCGNKVAESCLSPVATWSAQPCSSY